MFKGLIIKTKVGMGERRSGKEFGENLNSRWPPWANFQ